MTISAPHSPGGFIKVKASKSVAKMAKAFCLFTCSVSKEKSFISLTTKGSAEVGIFLDEILTRSDNRTDEIEF